jgi:hypothetical protein
MHGAKCKNGAACEAGKRVRTLHLLAGSTLPLWGTVRTAPPPPRRPARPFARASSFEPVPLTALRYERCGLH